MFLDKYIEPSILRKTSLIKALWEDEVIRFTILANKLAVSVATIKKDCAEFLDYMFFDKESLFWDEENIYLRKDKLATTLEKILSFLFRQSIFLKIFSFYLFSDKKKEYKNIHDYFYISKTKYYIEQKKIKDYLKTYDLHLNKCRVIGNKYKVIWLKALLDYFYFLNNILMNNKENRCIVDFVYKMNYLDNVYYGHDQKEIFLRIFILALSNEIELPNELMDLFRSSSNLPINLIKEIEKKVRLYEIDKMQSIIDVLAVTLFILNEGIFSPKVDKMLRKENLNRFLNNSQVKDLIERLEETTAFDISSSKMALNIIHDQLKTVATNPFIIPYKIKEGCVLEEDKKRYEDVWKVLKWWNEDKKLRICDFEISRLLEVMTFSENTVEPEMVIYIISDSWENYKFLLHLLKKNIKLKVKIIDLWLTEEHLKTLYLELDHVIFIRIVNSHHYCELDRVINVNRRTINELDWEKINLKIMDYIL